MTQTYDINYGFHELVIVEIDEEEAAELIIEMVEFWGGWEDAVDENDGSYIQTWLKNLAKFIICNRRLPDDDEGWGPLDGTRGIAIKDWDIWRPESDEIFITKRP